MDATTIMIGSIVAIAVVGTLAGIVLVRRQTQQRRDAEYHVEEQHRIEAKEHVTGIDVGALETEAQRRQRAADSAWAEAMRARADELDPEVDLTDRTLAEQRDAERQVRQSHQRQIR